MSWLYLAALIVSILCIGLMDHRWRLFLFDRPRVAVLAVVTGFLLFLVWDLVAIELRLYAKGASPAMTGIEVADELPLEELFFITFLCYITGVTNAGISRLLRHARSRQQVGAR